MSACAVATCTNYYSKTKAAAAGIVYHRFPKEHHLRVLWIAKCKRVDKFNSEKARMCSAHFTTDDYDKNLMNELLGVAYKKKIKHDAVPSLNLPYSKATPKPSMSPSVEVDQNSVTDNTQSSFDGVDNSATEREARNLKLTIRKRALQTIATLSPKKEMVDKSTFINTEDPEKVALKRQNEQLKLKARLLEKSLLRLQHDRKKARQKLCKSKQIIAIKIEKNKLKKLKRQEDARFKERFTNVLQGIFSPGQIKCFLNGGARVKWTSEDISSALELRATSQQTYSYLRNKGIPLPSKTTLRNWTKDFNCIPENPEVEEMTSLEQQCILSFDEMNVDSTDDGILGQNENIQVIVLSGLC